MKKRKKNKRNIKIVSVKPGVIVTPLWDKSIKENTALMDNCEGYEKEMNFIAKNAQKNETKGLSVEKVVDVINYLPEKENYANVFTKSANFISQKLGLIINSKKRQT